MALLALLALLALSLAAPASAGVIYVDQNAPGATRDGTSWATAFNRIQEGLSAATPGDEVWVARGTYGEGITLVSAVALYGGFSGEETERRQRDWRANETVLSPPSKIYGIFCDRIGAELNGFTVRDCNTGVYVVTGGTITLTNNRFTGMSFAAVHVPSGATAVVSRNRITNSYVGVEVGGSAILTGNAIAANGTGIKLVSGWVLAAGNTICGNAVGARCEGTSTAMTLSNNIIAFNTEGGVSRVDDAKVSLSANDVFGNPINYHGTPDATGRRGNISVDPKLSSIYRDFHIQPDSPCRNAGDADSYLEAFDIDGQARMQGGAVDIGADESNGTVHTVTKRIWYVSPSGADANAGLSWALPRKTVTSALWSAEGEDEVWVAKGTYSEQVAIPACVALYGGFAGTESATNQRNIAGNLTVLEAGGAKLNLVTCELGRVVVDGFTILNGHIGIYVNWCTATLANNVITGMTEDGVNGRSGSTVTIQGCTISNNARGLSTYGPTTIVGNVFSGNTGWGLFVSGAATVTNNVITGNAAMGALVSGSATLTDNTIQGNGYGVQIQAGPANMVHNIVSGNRIDGVHAKAGSATMSRNVISDNTGRGVFVETGSVTLDSNRLSGNTGAGVQVNAGALAVLNNNTLAKGNGAGVMVNGGTARLVNNIIAYNTSFGVRQTNATNALTMIKNDVFGNVPDYYGVDIAVQAGNFSQDPGMPGLATGDYRLSGKSTLIDKGDNAAVQPGALDLDGKPRILGTAVDLGAYEFGLAGFSMADVLTSLRITGGTHTSSPADVARLNLAVPADARISLSDAARLARKAAGLETNP